MMMLVDWSLEFIVKIPLYLMTRADLVTNISVAVSLLPFPTPLFQTYNRERCENIIFTSVSCHSKSLLSFLYINYMTIAK